MSQAASSQPVITDAIDSQVATRIRSRTLSFIDPVFVLRLPPHTTEHSAGFSDRTGMWSCGMSSLGEVTSTPSISF